MVQKGWKRGYKKKMVKKKMKGNEEKGYVN